MCSSSFGDLGVGICLFWVCGSVGLCWDCALNVPGEHGWWPWMSRALPRPPLLRAGSPTEPPALAASTSRHHVPSASAEFLPSILDNFVSSFAWKQTKNLHRAASRAVGSFFPPNGCTSLPVCVNGLLPLGERCCLPAASAALPGVRAEHELSGCCREQKPVSGCLWHFCSFEVME